MIIGRVDVSRRALVQISLRASTDGSVVMLDAWIDSGFTGDLVLPHFLVTKLALPVLSQVDVGLADGSETTLETLAAFIDWFGELRKIEVIANEGQFPLLGTGLLAGHRVVIDYNSLAVEIQ